ncbi:MAG TPA: pitrilysin family protein [Candidatus Bathyarchaeia archaeon]|nr:pitrilysin family protein [Candidatus Bathyarchaeia archaeon]
MRAALAAALLLAASVASAPAAAQPSAPPVAREVLPSGLVVLVRESPTSPVVAVSLMLRMGALVETPETAGISNLLQTMLVRGTATRSGKQIVEDADGLGGTIDGYGDTDYGEIAATALSRNWRPMLALVAEVAQRPSFPEGTLAAVKDFLVLKIRNRGDRPFDAGLDTLLARLFGSNPNAWDPLGRRESLERLDRSLLLDYYRQYYRGGDLVLAVSGRVKAAEVIPEARRLFSELPGGRAAALSVPAPPPPAASREVIRVPGGQAQVFMGVMGAAFSEADHAPLRVLATVLGGGFASRFFAEIRDAQGLAYTALARYPMRVTPGPFYAFLGTAPESTERSEAALRGELERVQREPVTDKELRVAKAFVLGTLAMDRRTNARQAWYLARYELAGVGRHYADRYSAQIEQVTAADIQRVARRYLAQIATVIVRPPE